MCNQTAIEIKVKTMTSTKVETKCTDRLLPLDVASQLHSARVNILSLLSSETTTKVLLCHCCCCWVSTHCTHYTEHSYSVTETHCLLVSKTFVACFCLNINDCAAFVWLIPDEWVSCSEKEMKRSLGICLVICSALIGLGRFDSVVVNSVWM